jgi:hypothetical protein
VEVFGVTVADADVPHNQRMNNDSQAVTSLGRPLVIRQRSGFPLVGSDELSFIEYVPFHGHEEFILAQARWCI